MAEFWGVLVLYAGWQAGYAACLGVALPSRYAGGRRGQ